MPLPLKSIAELSSTTPAVCCVCRRQAGPKGHGGYLKPIYWHCKDQECEELTPLVEKMATPDFNEIEFRALKEGGRAMWQYMASLGKTDIKTLTKEEATEAMSRVVDGFGCSMRAMLIADRDKRHG